MDFVVKILHNRYYMIWIMAAIIFLLTQAIKIPIKHFTVKIKVERTRKAVNSVILLLPFAFGCLGEYLYDTYLMKTAFDVAAGFILGGQSIALYGIFERFLGVKIENPYDSEEGKAVLEKVDEAVADGTITTDEIKEIASASVNGKSKKTKKADKKAETVEETPDTLQEFIDGIDLK